MPSPPERKIERLLKAYARSRRAGEGPPYALHPATRQMLLGEVRRRYGRRESDLARSEAWVTRWWRPLVWAISCCVLVSGTVLVWLWNPASSSRQLAAAPAAVRSEPMALGAPSAPGLPADHEQPATTTIPRSQDAPPPSPALAVAEPAAVSSMPMEPPAVAPPTLAMRSAAAPARTAPMADAAAPAAPMGTAPLLAAPAPALPSPTAPSVASRPPALDTSAPPLATRGAMPTSPPPLAATAVMAAAGKAGVSSRYSWVRERIVNPMERPTAKHEVSRSRPNESQARAFAAGSDWPTGVLDRFTLERQGATVRLIDADGSVYVGKVITAASGAGPATTAIAAPRASAQDRAKVGRQPMTRSAPLPVRNGLNRANPPEAGDGFAFEVSGTNQQAKLPVRVWGEWRISGATPTPTNALEARLTGQVWLGGTNRFQLEAVRSGEEK